MHKGIAVSPGVVVGVAHRVDAVFRAGEPVSLASREEIPAEIERLRVAMQEAGKELETVVVKVGQQVGASVAAIFESHLTILQDRTLFDKAAGLIAERGITAVSSLNHVLQEYAAIFAAREQSHFREKMADLRDVVARVGTHLGEVPISGQIDGGVANREGEAVVLVAHELLPSQAMFLGELSIGGIVTETGGNTSHAAILARSRGIPAVSGCSGITGVVETGDTIVVDGRDGHVLVRPDTETIAAYRKIQREFVDLKDQLILNRDLPSVSADGTPVELLANINNATDAQAAERVGAAGVGLYRTEYLFITHPTVPDEREQYEAYRQVIESSPGKSVTIRTLDLGGDKTVPYLGRRHEANPFMGWRSIRLAFEHPRLFETQIRAILRAAVHGRVSMLFPMVTTLEELRYVNDLVDRAKESLRRDRISFGEDVKTGVMIEVPAAAVCIDALLRETDFISIGSNDLIQYLVAADRDNPKVAHLCEPLSPAIFRILNMVLEACRRTGTPVTICGEMAGQPKAVLALFGMGLRRFSMSPAFVPMVKTLFSSVSAAQAERYAHQVLQLKTSEEIKVYLTARLHEVSRQLEMFDLA